MKNNYQQLRVTLPQATDLNNAKVGLTDFAIYSAPRPQQFGTRRTLPFHEINADGCKRYAVGDFWLRRASTLVPGMVLSRECETGLTFAREVDATDVTVAPQFQKIAAGRLGIDKIDQHNYLTIADKVATYPATAVKSNMANKLTDAVNDNDPAVQFVDYVRLPAQSSVQVARIYQYQGQNYVYAISKGGKPESQWFNCEPVRVQATGKGSLQCLDGLFVMPFADYAEFSAKQDAVKHSGEIDTDRFVLGQYLNFAFTRNLERLALPEEKVIAQLQQAHKLRHLVSNFTQAAKKLVAPIIER